MVLSFSNWFESKIVYKNTIYKDDTGYIVGYQQEDGYWWIEKFVIYPQFRGKNLARKLASHLPFRSKLLAYPLVNMGDVHLPQEKLIDFYISLGFEKTKDGHGNIIMQRG